MCVIDALSIMMRQSIFYAKPTYPLTIVNVFVRGVGAGVVQRPGRDIHVIQSAFENLGILLVGQGGPAPSAKSTAHAMR